MRRFLRSLCAISVLLGLCFSLTSCMFLLKRTQSGEETTVPTQPEPYLYERPSHWTPIGDEVLETRIPKMQIWAPAMRFTVPETVEALPTPVALVMKLRCHTSSDVGWSGDCCLAQTDLFETTDDLAAARSVIYVEVETQNLRNYGVEDRKEYETGLVYTAWLIGKDGSNGIKLSGKNDFPAQQTGVTDKPNEFAAVTPQTDDAFFAHLAERIAFSPEASDDLTLTLSFFAETALQATREADHALIRQALADYEYPASEDLDLHPELLDAGLPILLYPTDEDLYPDNVDPGDYVRPEGLLENYKQTLSGDLSLSDPNAFDRPVSVWGRALRGETTRLIAVSEVVGADLLNTVGGLGGIYEPIWRLTVLDAATGRVIGWKQAEPRADGAAALPNTISTAQLIKLHNRWYWTFSDGSGYLKRRIEEAADGS